MKSFSIGRRILIRFGILLLIGTGIWLFLTLRDHPGLRTAIANFFFTQGLVFLIFGVRKFLSPRRVANVKPMVGGFYESSEKKQKENDEDQENKKRKEQEKEDRLTLWVGAALAGISVAISLI